MIEITKDKNVRVESKLHKKFKILATKEDKKIKEKINEIILAELERAGEDLNE